MIRNPIIALARYLVKAEIPEDLAKNFLAKYPSPTQEQLQDLVDKNSIEDKSEIDELMYDLDKLGVYNLEKPNPAETDWTKKALKELADKEDLDFDELEITDENPNHFEAEGDGDWLIFKTYDNAETYAINNVTDDMKSEPEMFNQDFMLNYLTIGDTNARLIANDDADAYYDDMDDDDVIENADREGLSYTDIDDAKEQLKSERSDEIEQQLQKDILGYFEDVYGGKGEEATKAAYEWGYLDTEEAAKDAVSTDGVEHYLASYDGEEVTLPSGYHAYRTN